MRFAKRLLKRQLKRALILAVLFSPLVIAWKPLHQAMMYPAPSSRPPMIVPRHVEKITFESNYGFLLKPPTFDAEKTYPVVIFFHGNATAAHFLFDRFEPLLNRDYLVYLAEYPGYGSMEGSPSLESIQQTALSTYDYLAKQSFVDKNRIVTYGQSIGGGIATILASKRSVAALVLESTFYRITDLTIRKGIPNFLVRDQYDNAALIKKLKMPIFIMHGTDDRIIPIHHGHRLKDLAPHSQFRTLNCGHNDCEPDWLFLLNFLKKL